MSERETILQAVRSWAKAWADSSPLTDDQVIVGEDPGGRPALPYLTVYVTMAGRIVGHDETVWTLSDPGEDPQYRVQGEREGIVAVHGYGIGVEDWMDNLALAVHDPQAVDLLATLGLVLGRPLAGVRAVPRMRNASNEPHYVVEFPASYRSESPVRGAVNFAPPVEETDLDSPDPLPSGSLPLDITVETP